MVYEQDEWSSAGPSILDPERLAKIARVLADEGPVILEHWFYRGSRAPSRLVFDDYDDFIAYLKTEARPGDAFHVWHYAELCRNDNQLAEGKFPDTSGRTPRKGAY